MKRHTLLAAAVTFALASTPVAGQGVKMTDQQLDQVTAAGALSMVVISNPGNASVSRNVNPFTGRHATCINCPELQMSGIQIPSKTGGALQLQNRKFTVDNPMSRCIGAGMAGLC